MSNDPDVLRLSREKRFLRIASAFPFVLGAMFGLFSLLLVLDVPMENKRDEAIGRVLMPILAIVCIAIGSLMLWGRWETVIPVRELEEVRVEGKGGDWLHPCLVTVRSANAHAEFGLKLSRAECEYLAAISRAIAAKGESRLQDADLDRKEA